MSNPEHDHTTNGSFEQPAQTPQGGVLRQICSPQVGQIAAALARVQAGLRSIRYDADNTYYSSRYVTLAAVLDVIHQPLGEAKIALVQTPVVRHTEKLAGCVTMLIHESGEFLLSECVMPVDKENIHGYGSAITYARRYSIMAMLGLAGHDEDDDGNTAADVQPEGQSDIARKIIRAVKPASKIEPPKTLGEDYVLFKLRPKLKQHGVTLEKLIHDVRMRFPDAPDDPSKWPAGWASRIDRWFEQFPEPAKTNEEAPPGEESQIDPEIPPPPVPVQGGRQTRRRVP